MSQNKKVIVQTVNGSIDPEELGKTLAHEHILCNLDLPGSEETPLLPEITLGNVWDINYRWNSYRGNAVLNNEELMIRELKIAKKQGVDAIIEMTSRGIYPNPEGLQRIAAAAQVHIIAASGFYTEPTVFAQIESLNAEKIALILIDDITKGINGTEVKAGLIGEIGCSGSWTPLEQKVLHAAVLAQQETGVSINVHPHRNEVGPLKISQFVRSHGGDVSRLIISHLDRTIHKEEALLKLADSGCGMEYDYFGIETSFYPFSKLLLPNDGQRLKWIQNLIDHGHLEQIFISQDICTQTRLIQNGGHGYGHITRNVLPLMVEQGFSKSDIDTIIRTNPKRICSRILS